jgi:enoyl-CoA hydratase
MSEADAMDFEFGSMSRVAAESLQGAARFAAGAGRHGAGAASTTQYLPGPGTMAAESE